MLRCFYVATLAAAVIPAAPAHAVLAYQRGNGEGQDAAIVAARNDGSHRRVVAHGFAPRVSPTGHRIAYLRRGPDADDLYVVGNRGRHRHRLVRRVFDSGPFNPVAWSPDDRYLVVADPRGGGHLVDVRMRSSRHVKAGGDFGGASFTPDGSAFAICGATGAATAVLHEVDVATLTRRSLKNGCDPLWGQRGLAFGRVDRLLLRKHIGERPETLLHRTAVPIDWSADGARLLACDHPSSTHARAVLIDLSSRTTTRIDEPIFPAALSSDGEEILGESSGDVVVRRANGALKVLATNATRPSWTK